VPFFAQNACKNEILFADDSLIAKNQIGKYIKYDFSDLWVGYSEIHPVDNEIYYYPAVYGIIGQNYQRLQMKILTVVKTENKPDEYLVYGKSKVKNNICDFVGKISVYKIQELANLNFGVDDIYADDGIKVECLLSARYEFYENKQQKGTGIFSGELQSKFLINKNDSVFYDALMEGADGYYNNAFVGTWKSYNSNVSKICNWGDWRVPNVNCNFDIGAGEFSPADEYLKFGWENFRMAWYMNDEISELQKAKARQIEKEQWWK